MIYPIVLYGNKILRKKAEKIPLKEDLSILVEDMFSTMYKAKGLGLAAPQIQISKQIFIIDTTEVIDGDSIKEAFINPLIIETSQSSISITEGCLSIPGINGKVSRKQTLSIRYFNHLWEEKEKEFSGLNAIVIQHEYDHLNGILFIDKLTDIKKIMIKKQLKKVNKREVKCDYLTK